MPDTLMLPFQRPSDEELAVLRRTAREGKSSAITVNDLLDDVPRSWLRACEHAGLVQQTDRVFLTPLGRLVLAACDTDAPDPVGKVVEVAALSGQPTAEVERLKQRVGELEWAVQACWGFFDQCCQDQRNMVPNKESMRDICAQALSDTPERGEGGAG